MPSWMETLSEIPAEEVDQLFTIYTDEPSSDIPASHYPHDPDYSSSPGYPPIDWGGSGEGGDADDVEPIPEVQTVKKRQGNLALGKWDHETLDKGEYRRGRSFHLFRFGFSIHPLSKVTYKEMGLEIVLDDEDCTAKILTPETTYQKIDSTTEYGITAQFAVETPVTPSVEYKETIKYPYLHPVIESGPIGTHFFAWKFAPQKGTRALTKGSRAMAVVLDTPIQKSVVSGIARTSFKLSWKNITEDRTPDPIEIPFEWDLTKQSGYWPTTTD